MGLNIITNAEGKPSKISGLYQGDAFTGKSEYACSWPNVVVLNFDPDSQTAQKHLKARGGNVVGIIELDSWNEFSNKVQPHIKSRSLEELVGGEVETVVVDTMSIAAQRLADEIQGNKDKLRIQDFGLLLQKLTEATTMLSDTCKPTDSHPGYNVIITTHLKTVTDDAGNTESIRPAIMGQFRDLLPRLLGFAFLCETKLNSVLVSGQPAKQEAEWYVRTVPPNSKYICGDRIAAAEKPLPATCSGRYLDLMKLWGRDA
jgi:hypothetical protein